MYKQHFMRKILNTSVPTAQDTKRHHCKGKVHISSLNNFFIKVFVWKKSRVVNVKADVKYGDMIVTCIS